MVRKWLITGGCGFIGTSLIGVLQKQGKCQIRILDNLSVGTREKLSLYCDFKDISPEDIENADFAAENEVHLVEGDIRDREITMKAAKDMDIIVHLAANTGVQPSIEKPLLDMESNILGIVHLLEAARKNRAKRFVFASSNAPVGICTPPIHEEMAPHPVSPYGASKLAGEGYCSAYFHSFGLDTVALRFGNVYGPGSDQKNSVVAKFIKLALSAKTLEIYGDGTQTRDFIYIDDLVNAVLLAAAAPGIGGETFQIATSHETTILELRNTLVPVLQEMGCKNVEVAHASPLKGDVQRNFSDTKKAKTLLGWEAKMPLEKGLVHTVAYFTGKTKQ